MRAFTSRVFQGEVQREGPPGTGISQKEGPHTAVNHCLRRTAAARVA